MHRRWALASYFALLAACSVFPETPPEAVHQEPITEAGTDTPSAGSGGAEPDSGPDAEGGAGEAGDGGGGEASGGEAGDGGGAGGQAGDSGGAGGEAGDSGGAGGTAGEAGVDAEAGPDSEAGTDSEAGPGDSGPDSEAGSVITVQVKVGAGTDDANEDNGVMVADATSVWLGMGTKKNTSYTGFRFPALQVPKGATVLSAKIRVYSVADANAPLTFTYSAEDANSCGAFAASAKLSSRPLTSATVDYQDKGPWMHDSWQTLDDISSVLQEVLGRPGWVQGNSLCIILRGMGPLNERRNVSSFEGSPTQAAVLEVQYKLP